MHGNLRWSKSLVNYPTDSCDFYDAYYVTTSSDMTENSVEYSDVEL